ncbi:ImmA/IrrE family metallo-endopeptidase [Arthrobacter sp. E3]|uniref:ImmA/IrrE family metallo-endopeptidase n=1 Tax=Arthrobacter sp. E3 TaxID=517402 RepID=UPI001A942F19|nr:ImmA/IrrE family metallo-endopeptidase [Arthrobacter sp. E3]
MSIRDARRAANQANKALILGGNVSVETIRKAIEALRGITITVQEMPVDQHDVPAFTADCGNLKVVYYAPNLSTLHRQHNILHEFSHLLLNHEETATGITIKGFSETFPTQPRKIMGRFSFDDDAEQSAEFLAYLLSTRISGKGRDERGGSSGLEEVFG